MKLGNKTVGQELIVVAEAGSTTRGNPEIAKQLATAAKDAGVDAIKYILSDPETLSTDKTLEYDGKLLYDVVKSYQISAADWRGIVKHCQEIELPYYFSVGTRNLVPLAVELGSEHLKLSAWDARNYPLIDDFLETGLPIQIDIG